MLWLNISVSLNSALEFWFVITRYYTNQKFFKVDLALLAKYLWKSPFRISKKFLIEANADDVYTYGETPLTTMALIAQQCKITADDCVLELGCGRGRTCFWLNCFIKCKVIGIEYIPAFIHKAQKVKNRYSVDGVDFVAGDMLEADFSKGSVIYLYGTCYDQQFLAKLIKKMESLPRGTKIITVSYSLSEFGAREFTLQHGFTAPFTWGLADVYLQIRK